MKTINVKTACAAYRAIVNRSDELARMLRAKERGWLIHDTDIDYAKTAVADADRALCDDAAYAKLTAALGEVQKRSKERTISTLEIVETLCKIDDTLGISRNAMDGVRVAVDLNAQHFAKAYRFTPQSTWFYASYKSGGWRVEDIRREACAQRHDGITVYHTEASRAALIERFTRFSI